MNGKLMIAIVATAALAVVLLVAQMWFAVFSTAVFVKVLLTLVLLGGLAAFLLAVWEDYAGDKKRRDDKFLD